jgi:sulfoxide reductase heme-binding subunit YedZ
VNSLVPLAMLGWYEYHGHAGANPPEYAVHTTGMLALVFLLLSLCVTPLRQLTGINWFSNFRRMLGLFSFFYAVLHFFLYLGFYQSWRLTGFLYEITHTNYIFYGLACLTLMIPLALTSTTGAIKRMGAKNWKNLHSIVYLAAIAAVVHYYNLVKLDHTIPDLFAIALIALLYYRLVNAGKKNLPAPVIPLPTER